jgi:hypothetical protein
MDELLSSIGPAHETVSREHEKQILRAERETERAGGAPLPEDADFANLRPELLAQLAHVRELLARELAAVGPDEACLTCSFQAEDVLLLCLAMELRPEIPVLFLDTGYHFKETYEYRDRMAAEWNLNLTNLLPRQTVAQQESEFGLLYQTEPNRCCGFRKVEPLFEAVAKYKVYAGRVAALRLLWHSSASPVRPRLHQHRLRTMYHAAHGPERSPFRPMGRQEGRVRHPHPGHRRGQSGCRPLAGSFTELTNWQAARMRCSRFFRPSRCSTEREKRTTGIANDEKRKAHGCTTL